MDPIRTRRAGGVAPGVGRGRGAEPDAERVAADDGRAAGPTAVARADPAAATPSEEHIDVARALEALPRRQREVAVLRYLLEMSTAEVAAALGIAEGTVKSSLARARAHLVEALAVHDTEVTNDVEGR